MTLWGQVALTSPGPSPAGHHWQITANPDRTITWTSRRTGRTYTTHPYNFRDGP